MTKGILRRLKIIITHRWKRPVCAQSTYSSCIVSGCDAHLWKRATRANWKTKGGGWGRVRRKTNRSLRVMQPQHLHENIRVQVTDLTPCTTVPFKQRKPCAKCIWIPRVLQQRRQCPSFIFHFEKYTLHTNTHRLKHSAKKRVSIATNMLYILANKTTL